MRTKHVLLIVEDDVDLNDIYKMFCLISVERLNQAGLALEAEVLQAFSYTEASAILAGQRVDFISVDLALRDQDRGISEAERRSGKQPGGMQILKDAAALPNPPISVVVSGETLLSYARDALQKYGALAYYQKSQPGSEEKYMHAVQAALWYLEAAALLSELEEYAAGPDVMRRASEYWSKAREEAEQADASERGFPRELEPRIDAARLKLDPAAKIPGDSWTEQMLRNRVLRRDDWVIMQVELHNYTAITAGQASQVGPIFYHVSDLLEKANAQNGRQEMFTGIWRRERTDGPCLLAILQRATIVQAEKMAARVSAEFQEIAGEFTNTFQAEQELPRLAVKFWDGASQPFADWQDLVNKINRPVG